MPDFAFRPPNVDPERIEQASLRKGRLLYTGGSHAEAYQKMQADFGPDVEPDGRKTFATNRGRVIGPREGSHVQQKYRDDLLNSFNTPGTPRIKSAKSFMGVYSGPK